MHLVDDEDDIAELFDLVDEALHPALKLAAELRARDKRRQIEQPDFFALQFIRHIPRRDLLREALCHSRLADARLADQAGVVLLPAV